MRGQLSGLWKSVSVPSGVFLATVVAVTLLWWQLRVSEQRRFREEFDRQTSEVMSSLRERVDTMERLLRAQSGLFTGGETPTRDTWQLAIAMQQLERWYPGVQGVGYASWLSEHELASFQTKERESGRENFLVYPQTDASHLAVITYLEPSDWRNLRAIGFDMASETVRRQAMERAGEQAGVQISGPVTLVQETETDPQTGVLFYLPVYQQGRVPPNKEGRKSALKGFVYSPLRMRDFTQSVFAKVESRLSIQLVDADAPAPPLYQSAAFAQHFPDVSLPRERHILQLSGRRWHLNLLATPASLAQGNVIATGAGLMGGVAISLVISGALFVYLTSREKALHMSKQFAAQLSEQEAQFRRLVEFTPVGIFLVDLEGRIALANTKAQIIFGINESGMSGMQLQVLIPGLDLAVEYKQSDRMLGESAQVFGSKILAAYDPAGEKFDVQVAVVKVVTPSGPGYIVSAVDMRGISNAEARFRQIVEVAPNAIVLVNQEGLIQLANQQAERLFGYGRQELLGHSIDMLLPEELRTRHAGLRNMFSAAPTARPMGVSRELFGRHRDGRHIPVEVGLAPIYARGEVLIHAAVSDMTQRKENEQKLRQQAEALARASSYKSEFLTNMSHELRTPLNSILILSDLLSKMTGKVLEEKQIGYVDIIQRAGRDLLALINGVLDLSKVESGKFSFDFSELGLKEFFEYIEGLCKPLADEKGLGFAIEIAADAPSTIVSDRVRLEQIVKNLIGNAIKFTAEGHVKLVVYAGSDEGVQQVCIDVIDTGIGIEAVEHKKIFQAFHQVDSSTSREHGGTGLGLTITEKLVQLLGGHISVTSAPGQGSCFHVQLPVNGSGASLVQSRMQGDTLLAVETPAAAVNRSESTAASNSVLVVDDDVRNLQAMQALLESMGLEVTCVAGGKAALEATRQSTPGMVMLDMAMPGMDGYEVVREWKRQGRSFPVVAVTAHAMKGDAERCMDAGCDDYLAKPVSREAIESVLAKWKVLRWETPS